MSNLTITRAENEQSISQISQTLTVKETAQLLEKPTADSVVLQHLHSGDIVERLVGPPIPVGGKTHIRVRVGANSGYAELAKMQRMTNGVSVPPIKKVPQTVTYSTAGKLAPKSTFITIAPPKTQTRNLNNVKMSSEEAAPKKPEMVESVHHNHVKLVSREEAQKREQNHAGILHEPPKLAFPEPPVLKATVTQAPPVPLAVSQNPPRHVSSGVSEEDMFSQKDEGSEMTGSGYSSEVENEDIFTQLLSLRKSYMDAKKKKQHDVFSESRSKIVSLLQDFKSAALKDEASRVLRPREIPMQKVPARELHTPPVDFDYAAYM